MAIVSAKRRFAGREIQEATGGDQIVETWIVISDNTNELHETIYDSVPVEILDKPTKINEDGDIGEDYGDGERYEDLYCISKTCRLEGSSGVHWIVTCVYARQMSPLEPVKIKTGTWTLRKNVPTARVIRPGQGLAFKGGFAADSAETIDLTDEEPKGVSNVVGDPYANTVMEEYPQSIITYNWRIPLSANTEEDVLVKFMEVKDRLEGTMNDNDFILLKQTYGTGLIKLQRMNASLEYRDFNEKSLISSFSTNDNALLNIEMQFYINNYAEKLLTTLGSNQNTPDFGWFKTGWFRAIAEMGHRIWGTRTVQDENGNDQEVVEKKNVVNPGDNQKSNSPQWLNTDGEQLSKEMIDERAFPYSIWQTIEATNFEDLRIFGLPEGIGNDVVSYELRKKPNV